MTETTNEQMLRRNITIMQRALLIHQGSAAWRLATEYAIKAALGQLAREGK